ncbi:uncharacterized protein LOC123222581 isoform X2 [Mangifera indica]|uniref:uncharacterized protein LOC123222581 isoform X2 n=1 Tax=Mangifera indica TaxID=29780 RepID=UPI001CFBE9CB|nr:uncharacterized protein LOC123222581 isoform X2 [Mangifera indica]
MVQILIPCHCYYPILSLLLICFSSTWRCFSLGELNTNNTFSVSNFRYPETWLRPFDSRYIRVDLPPWFSSLSIRLESNVNLDFNKIFKVPISALPLICLRDGSLPLPDVSEITLKGLCSPSNGSSKVFEDLENVEQCFPMQENISVKLTNEQISPGVWYLGLFNGIGDTRTQSKMIVRGPTYAFIANISVEGCTTSTIWGQFCNQTVNPLSNSFDSPCHGIGETNVYSLDVVGITEQLTIMALNVSFNMTPSINTVNVSGTNIMCFARHGALPSSTLYDFSGDIQTDPLTIPSPKVGRWYITVIPANLSKELGEIHNTNAQVCYSLEWQVLECPLGKAGSNCMWESYNLQTGIRRDSFLFESSYVPVSGKVPADSADFPLEPLLSNSSYGGESDDIWTYFLMDVPVGAAGGNIHIQLTSDTKMKYEIYAKFGGLPSLQSWDYYYANRTNSSIGCMFFKLYNSSEEKVDFYILYAREGTWGFGIRHVNTSSSKTTMSISFERCPRRCSSHGQCTYDFDASGLTSYSYCSCDRDYGGFDCSVEIVSHQGHIWQSIALIASNAAALLPAYCSLRRKAFAEWVLFTSSGISSALYHACDVGTWCALSYNVLQFMDFWLSFMAVVSTFVYLTTVDEAFKRTIHTAVAILTALLALTKATRSSNIILVIAIGTFGLLVGWVVELSTKFRLFSFSIGSCRNVLDRQQTVTQWVCNLIKTLLLQFRWPVVLAGFTALAMAAISWKLESSENYWIWHSIWHVTMYTSSFFFLCSKKIDNVNSEVQRPGGETSYQLTRQNSIPSSDRREGRG